jgi:hypothetical protein
MWMPTSRVCWECDQALAEYDEGHIVTDFSASAEDWKMYCEDCWQRMLKDKEG